MKAEKLSDAAIRAFKNSYLALVRPSLRPLIRVESMGPLVLDGPVDLSIIQSIALKERTGPIPSLPPSLPHT